MNLAGKPYAFFEHTADIGIRARGKTLAALLIAMAQGFVELIAEQSVIPSTETRAVDLAAENAEGLLLVWLQELLFWFSTDRFVPVSYALSRVTATRLHAEVRGGRFDPQRDTQGREVKAITRHQLHVRRAADGWRARVIVDI